MLYCRFVLLIRFDCADDHSGGFFSDLKSREFHRSKGCLQHVPNTVARHAQNSDVIRRSEPVVLQSSYGAHSLCVCCCKYRIKLRILINQFYSAIVSVFYSPQFGIALCSDLRQAQFLDCLLVTAVTIRVRGNLFGAVDQSNLSAALIIKICN